MKNCKRCGNLFEPTNAFYCPQCMRDLSRKWRIDNLEKSKAKDARNYAKNAEKVKAKTAKWYADHHEVALERARKHHAAHPELRRIHENNRRALKKSIGGKLSKGLAEKLFKLQRGKCACGCRQDLGNDYHLDHIMPIALGGANEDWNMQLLTQRCNNQKRAKHPIDFMQSRGFLL